MSAIAARRARQAAAAQASAQSISESSSIGRIGANDLVANDTSSGSDNNSKRPNDRIVDEENGDADERQHGAKRFKRIGRAVVEGEKEENLLNSSTDSDHTANGYKFQARTVKNEQENLLSKVTESSKFIPILEGECKNVHLLSQGEKSKAICAMEVGESMNLLGRGTVKLLDGSISIGGAILSPLHREVLVLAPTISPLPVLQACGTIVDPIIVKQYGFTLIKSFVAVVQIEEADISNVEEFHSICTQISKNAFEISSFCHPSWPLTAIGPQYTQSKTLLHAHIPSTWNRVLTAMEGLLQPKQSDPPTFLIRGPKRVGKSTLSRFLLQRLLTTQKGQVAYLETDLGQSEFGLPSTVSLHVFDSAWHEKQCSTPILFAPSWTSIRQPVHAHFLGNTSPKNNPGAYISAIENLLATYRRSCSPAGVPLIVNTQGWVKGLGANLLSQIETFVEPSVIFNLSEDVDVGEGDNIQLAPLPHIVTLEASPSLFTRERSMNSVESRSLTIVSCFSAINLPSTNADSLPRWSTSKALLERQPFKIDVSTGLKGGIHILDHGACVAEHLSLMALNGSCVALVISRDEEEDEGSESISMWRNALRKKIPTLDTSTCIGLGIVQSVDVAKGITHLLSPISVSFILSAANRLYGERIDMHSIKISIIKGAIDIPVCLSLDRAILDRLNGTSTDSNTPKAVAGIAFADVPYLDFDVNSTEDEIVIDMKKRRIRRNLLRPSQRKA